MDNMKPIAYIHTDLPEKFGIPRQSGLVKELTGRIVFEPEYRTMDAVKGLEGFNYIWLLWEFQGVERAHFNATVRPPRLGGNTRVGVFATRSPFRPNPIGLSSVHLNAIRETKEGPVLEVSGVDLKDQTPIYDIKPYLPYADCHPDALDGFTRETRDYHVDVVIREEFFARIPEDKQEALKKLLEQDPRPSYHKDETRTYGLDYAGYHISFVVNDGVLTVTDVVERQ